MSLFTDCEVRFGYGSFFLQKKKKNQGRSSVQNQEKETLNLFNFIGDQRESR